uniref:Reverse transcriptase domain-containing protein n=1 Tax=Leptobrachium leishanense TaxID=445787 RepID=A0A8C5PYV0_9ANUR
MEREAINDGYVHTHLKDKSSFFPKQLISDEMKAFEITLMKEVHTINQKKCKPNLTSKEFKALKNLNEDQTIIIKPADKGGGVVILPREMYNQEALRQLNDINIYSKATREQMNCAQEVCRDLLQKGNQLGIINETEFKYLNIIYPKIPVFYLLPKIHKDINNPPGRPIISRIESITSRLSQYIDILLQPLVKTTQAYLKDTTNVLELIDQIQWEPEYIMVTCDVTSLYSIIPHKIGCEAVKFFLEKGYLYPPDQIDFILESIELILKNNFFMFEGQMYRQETGMAMGTRFAPSYANLFMAYWEHFNIYSKGIWSDQLILYKRYIDDIFIIWKGDNLSLSTFLDDLNLNNWGIKLEYFFSKQEVNFLDLTIYTQDNSLKTKTFFKTVDVNSFIEFNSCHAKSWLQSVPKSQLMRLRRNCTEEKIFLEQADKLEGDPLNKGYKKEDLDIVMDNIRQIPMTSLYQKKEENHGKYKDNVSFIYDYNSQTREVNGIIKRCW